jgi:hypothetical protein
LHDKNVTPGRQGDKNGDQPAIFVVEFKAKAGIQGLPRPGMKTALTSLPFLLFIVFHLRSFL